MSGSALSVDHNETDYHNEGHAEKYRPVVEVLSQAELSNGFEEPALARAPTSSGTVEFVEFCHK